MFSILRHSLEQRGEMEEGDVSTVLFGCGSAALGVSVVND
jgi:hypothetical protein